MHTESGKGNRIAIPVEGGTFYVDTSGIDLTSEKFLRKLAEVEADFHLVWKPHDGQLPVVFALFNEFLPYIFMQCGRKFGKTEFVIYCLYLWACVFPNSQIYYVADTIKHGNELVWENRRLPYFFTAQKKLDGESDADYEQRIQIGNKLHKKYILKINNSEMRVFFRNGSFIKVEGAENYANADGIEPNLMAYDEFKSHDPRFHEAMEPNLKVKRAPLLIIGTPPNSNDNYYCKIARSIAKMKDGLFLKRPSYMNPHMYPLGINDPEFLKEKQKYIDRGDWDVFMREYMAEIVTGGQSAIFPMFRPEIRDDWGKVIQHTYHVRPHEEIMEQMKKYPKDWDYYAIYDAGSASCFAVLFAAVNKHTKKILLLDEIYEKDQNETSTGKIYPRAQKKMKELNPRIEWDEIYDNQATWFRNEVQAQFDRVLTPCDKDINKKEEKLSLIKDLYNTRGVLLQASDRCVNFSSETTNYQKDDKGKIPKENDHLIDDLRYLLNAAHYTQIPDFDEYPEEDVHADRRNLTIEDELNEDIEIDPEMYYTIDEDDYYD